MPGLLLVVSQARAPPLRGLITVVGEEIPLYNLLSLIDEALILSNVFSVM